MSTRSWSLEDARRLGATMRRIDPALMKRPSQQGQPAIWFQGDEPYLDAFFEIDGGGALAWFQVTVRGRSVTWDGATGALTTGHTGELSVEEGHPASKLVVEEDAADEGLVDFVRALLRARADEALLRAAADRLEPRGR